MRIIAGSLKGRRLSSPVVGRAAADVRQAARDAVQHPRAAHRRRARARRLRRHRRARHRGAQPRRVGGDVRRERSPRAQALIEENLARCGIADGYAIIRASVVARSTRFASRPRRRSTSCCSIRRDDGARDPGRRNRRGGRRPVAEDGVVVLEHARKRRRRKAAGALVRSREVISGDSALALYEVKQGPLR